MADLKDDHGAWWLIIERNNQAIYVKGSSIDAFAQAEALCEMYGCKIYITGQRFVYEATYEPETYAFKAEISTSEAL